jgi:hypothetical protein
VTQDRDAGLFVMEYLDPDRYPNWKSQLRDGILRKETAVAVAERLVAIHAATAGRPGVAAANDAELLMENTLVEFGVEFLGTIHSGVSRAPVRGVPYPFTGYGFLKRSMIFGSKGAAAAGTK